MDRDHTLCFSGYRPEKFTFLLHPGDQDYLALEKRLEAAILQAVDDGYTSFICGLAKGFDLVAGAMVVTLKESWPELAHLKLVAVRPFEGHGFASQPWRDLHRRVLGAADEVVTLSPQYHPQAYHDRNRHMVDHSSRLICFYDGKKGGTHYTVRYAWEHGSDIVNCAK